VVEVPVADGGEGTVDALVAAHKGRLVPVEVEGPLGEPVSARYGLIHDGRTAVVELASASGLPLVPPRRRDPRVSSTYGFGQLVAAARDAGAGAIIAGIGGSATNDGGAGMAQAIGYRLLDAGGRDLPRGGAALARLEHIDSSRVDPGWRRLDIKVACDVRNPLTGPEGATAVYGPQKGATPEMITLLDAALKRFAEVVRQDLGVDVDRLPGAGAAGGAGAGLFAFLGAELVPGAPLVVEASGLDKALDKAHLVFTGEGRVDAQTAYGKGPSEVARRAKSRGIPVVLLAGGLAKGWERVLDEGVTAVVPIAEGPATLEELQNEAEALLLRSAARICRLVGIM
jgi:glycerate kinase